MTNQTAPAVFNFNSHEVRTLLVNNEPVFCLLDVAKVLDIKNTKASRFNLSEKGVHKMYLLTNGGKQELTFINEPNLYRVIFRSNKEEAVEFQNWIFEEVLPAIRKTGTYTAEKAKASKSTADERTPLRDAINLLVSKKHILYPEAYSYVHQRFNVNHIDELKPSEITTAVEYVHKLALEGEVLEAELMHTLKLTDEELCSLAWLWRAADFMRSKIEEIEGPLRALNSGYAANFYSMSTEYRRVLNRSKVILERETRNINPHPTWMSHSNWRYALESLRN